MLARGHDGPHCRTLTEIESAIVEAELELTLNLVRLRRCRTAERNTAVAETLVTVAQVHLASLQQSRDEALQGRLGH
jgi:hypothetical protein